MQKIRDMSVDIEEKLFSRDRTEVPTTVMLRKRTEREKNSCAEWIAPLGLLSGNIIHREEMKNEAYLMEMFALKAHFLAVMFPTCFLFSNTKLLYCMSTTDRIFPVRLILCLRSKH